MPQMTASTARQSSRRSVSAVEKGDLVCGFCSFCFPWFGNKPTTPTIESATIELSEFLIASSLFADRRHPTTSPIQLRALSEKSRLLLHKGLRHPRDADDNCLTLSANARAKFGLISHQERQTRFGNVDVEFRAEGKHAILKAAQCRGYIRTAIASNFELSVSRCAQVHNQRNRTADVFVERSAQTPTDRAEVADLNICAALFCVELKREGSGCVPQLFLIQIDRAANREFVAPHAEAGVVVSSRTEGPRRNVEVVAGHHVRAFEVPAEIDAQEHVRVREAGAQIEGVCLNSILDEWKAGARADVCAEKLIVCNQVDEDDFRSRGQASGELDAVAVVVFHRIRGIDPCQTAEVQTRRRLRSVLQPQKTRNVIALILCFGGERG